MPVSDADRAKWERLVESLKVIETDEVPEEEALQVRLAWINRKRAEMGMPPLDTEDFDPPEEGFYRRARALGMVKRRH